MNILNLILLVLLTKSVKAIDDYDESTKLQKSCREKNSLIGDNVKIVEIKKMEIVEFDCHFCEEKDDEKSKVWYHIGVTEEKTPLEVKYGMNDKPELNRIRLSIDHTLTITNITEMDIGLYYCRLLQDDHYKIQYFLDVIYHNLSEPLTGNLSSWLSYKKDYLDLLNKRFKSSQETEFAQIRNWNFSLEAISEWDTEWGPCIVCGRMIGKAEKAKSGKCYIKVTNLNVNATETNLDYRKDFLNKALKFSCHSILACGTIFPTMGNFSKLIPNYILTEKCDGVCKPDNGTAVGWKIGKTKEYKYRKSFVLTLGSHLTLTCPESSIDSKIVWRKNGKELENGQVVQNKDGSPPNTIVDTFSTLYLKDVTEKEAGNYSCVVDDIRMQQIRVYIASKSKILTAELLRNMVYLGFILSLTLTCYCAGLYLAWKRRHTFRTVEYKPLINV